MKPEGLHVHRLKPEADNPREVAFAEQWAQEHGWHDLLASLMRCPCKKDDEGAERVFPMGFGAEYFTIPLGEPTERDRVIVATVIQWLGSNVGMSFIHKSFRRCGYGIRCPHEKH